MATQLTHTFQTEGGLQLAFTTGDGSGAFLQIDSEGAPSLGSSLSVDELAELRSLLGILLKQASKSTASSSTF